MKTLLLSAFLSAGALVFEAPAAAQAVRWEARCTAAGAPQGARCGALEVPEDRRRANGRKLPIHLVVAPGEDPKAEPIFFIAGGPGQSAIEVMPATLATLRSIDRRRDVVFVDQRGTGRSAPLSCADGFEAIDQGPGSDAFAACVRSLQSRASLDLYGTREAVEDLEAVRAALGHQRVNLAAASYGTRVALFYMRQYPSRVRATLLRAAAPLDFNIIGALGAADAALGRTIDDCRADTGCAAAYPKLEQQVRSVSARLAAKPEEIILPGPNGSEQRVQVTQTLFHQMLYALMLSAPARQQIPLVVSTAASRGFQPLAVVVGQIRNQLYGSLPVGMYLSIICSEDAPRLASLPRGRTPLVETAPKLVAVCNAWPVRPRPRNESAQPALATPTMIISGDLDPATTVAAANQLAGRLRNARHIVVPAMAHGPMLPECTRAAVAAFFESGSLSKAPPSDCSKETLPPFAVRAG